MSTLSVAARSICACAATAFPHTAPSNHTIRSLPFTLQYLTFYQSDLFQPLLLRVTKITIIDGYANSPEVPPQAVSSRREPHVPYRINVMCNLLCSASPKIHYRWTLACLKQNIQLTKAVYSRLFSVKENLRKGIAQNANLSSEDLNKHPPGLASVLNFDNK